MTTPDSDLRRLVRMPLQAFGRETPSAPPAPAAVASHVVLKAKPIPSSRLRIFFSAAHDVGPVLHAALGLVHQTDGRSRPERPDLHGRQLRRMLRTWHPRSHVDVAVHPANLMLITPEQEIVVDGWVPPQVERDPALSLAMLAAPLTSDSAREVLAALVTRLAVVELEGAARSLQQKRQSRNALPANGSTTGPQPATPPGRLPFRRTNLRPTLQRFLPARRTAHFAAA